MTTAWLTRKKAIVHDESFKTCNVLSTTEREPARRTVRRATPRRAGSCPLRPRSVAPWDLVRVVRPTERATERPKSCSCSLSSHGTEQRATRGLVTTSVGDDRKPRHFSKLSPGFHSSIGRQTAKPKCGPMAGTDQAITPIGR